VRLRKANDNEMESADSRSAIALRTACSPPEIRKRQRFWRYEPRPWRALTRAWRSFQAPLDDLQFRLVTQRTLPAHSSGMAHTAVAAALRAESEQNSPARA